MASDPQAVPTVLGILGGLDLDRALATRWLQEADVVLAADSGADTALELGKIPNVTVGDLDSLQRADELPDVRKDEDQDSSDADKLLALAVVQGYERITLVGVEGDRPDHVLAVHGSAIRSGLTVQFAYRRGIGRLIRPGEALVANLPAGVIVGLIPLTPLQGVSLTGVKWELEDAELGLDGLVSISNQALGGEARVAVTTGFGLVYVDIPGPSWDLWVDQ